MVTRVDLLVGVLLQEDPQEVDGVEGDVLGVLMLLSMALQTIIFLSFQTLLEVLEIIFLEILRRSLTGMDLLIMFLKRRLSGYLIVSEIKADIWTTQE